MLPLPFSRGVFIFGEPVFVASDAGDDEMESRRRELEAELNEITRRADNFFSAS